ncbi:MAG TPA: AlkA N-terminal domain-containing protein [Burkholderiaceae bacterium]|nr:AlkA N-terminal domain-containing protein [Burkholderiaceae bacterium]
MRPRPSITRHELRYRPPYDWPAMRSFLQRRAIPGIERVDDTSYARTVEIDGMQGIVRVAPAGRGDALRVTVRAPGAASVADLLVRLRRVLDTDTDPRPIAAHLRQDLRLAPLVAARPGLRLPGAWDGFELAVRAILGQQITVAAARALAGRLVAAHGAAMRDPAPGLTHVFPSPAAIAAVDPATLGLPRRRAATLVAMATAVTRKPAWLEAGRPLDEVVRDLCGIPGIGAWTAHYIAMRQMRDADAFPAADVALLRSFGNLDGARPTPKELQARAEAWRPWRAYAAQHLWTAA